MRRVSKLALTAAALGAALSATPASAAPIVVGGELNVPSCAAFSFTQNETKCAGGYEGNLQSGSPATGTALTAIQALGYTGSGAYLVPKLDGLGGASVLNFGVTLSGLTIIGIHYGASGAKPEATSFFLFDLLTPTNTITITGRAGANDLGTSNAVLYSTGGRSVPEPATWAMMLAGFGGIGMAMRRSRRRKNVLMQIA